MINYTYPLEYWQDPAKPVNGPTFSWNGILYQTMHYRGSLTNPVPLDIAAHLRASHASYLANRGYSYGYNAIVVSAPGHPQDGTSWEVRGERFRSAANAGANLTTFAIQVCQVDNAPVSSKAIAEIKRLGAQLNEHAGRKLTIVGHGQVPGGTTITPCPGSGVKHAIDTGLLDPGPYPQLPPPGLDEMQPIEPTRTYDTRANSGFAGAGNPMKVNEIRRIPVVIGTKAFVRIQAFGATKPGWIAVSSNGTFPAGHTSLVNFEGDGKVYADGAPVLAPGGHIYIKASQACNIISDTYAAG